MGRRRCRVIFAFLRLIPNGILARIGASGNGCVVGAVFLCREFNHYAIAHRYVTQRTRSDQCLGDAVEHRLCRNRVRGNRTDFPNRQRDWITGRSLKVLHFREADNHLIRTRVGGQASGVVSIACFFVRILEILLQVVCCRLNIDLHRREIACLHRFTIIFHFYRNGLNRGVPLKCRPVLAHLVGLGKGPVECNAGYCHRNVASVCTGHILHLVVSALHQYRIGTVGQGNCNCYIRRLTRAVIDQIP